MSKGRPSSSLILGTALGFVFVFAPSAALGQWVENCTGADLTGSSMLPLGPQVITPTTEDFVLTGILCTNPTGTAPDSVVCFRPTNNCTILYTCNTNPAAGATVWGNIRDLGATACTTAEGLCHTSTSGATAIGISVGLIAGTRYCFICSTSVMTAQTVSVTQGVGSPDCGPLPVELMLFEVDG